MTPMLELEQALEKILSAVPPALSELAALNQAHERISAEQIISPVDLPPFDNSAMDGYAVRSADLKTASADKPVRLKWIGKVAAGSTFDGEVQPGTCARIFTGSPLPRGADAVVMQEDTQVESSENILFLDSVKPWENIRLRGEDVKRGGMLVDAGCKLSAGQISLLGAVGVGELKVGVQPVVGLLATGSELLEPPQTLAPGKIFESNRAMLSALAARAGAKTKVFPLVPDALDATSAALEKAFSECDIVITSGGVSVGEMDFVKAAFESLGGKMEFWKVAIRPGKPFVFGRWREKFLFGLPGNPVSAFVTFVLLARPAILRWQGASRHGGMARASHPGVLAEDFVNRDQRRPHFVRVIVDEQGKIRSAGVQASHALSSLAAANGLLEIAPGAVLAAGKIVSVARIDF